jgi:hypothetical protein
LLYPPLQHDYLKINLVTAIYVTCKKRELHVGFWCGNLKERNHSEDLGEDGRMILRYLKGTVREWRETNSFGSE